MAAYSHLVAPDVTTPTTDDPMTAADDITVVSSSTQNISRNQEIPTIIEDLNLNTRPSLLSALPKIFLLGLCVLLFTIILILSCWYCLHRIRKRRAAKNVNADIYMDVTNIGSMQAISLNSVYQDLNAPPRLPDRRKSGMLHHDYESNIATDDDVKADLNLSQYITKGEPHKYMDMNTVYETPDNEKDFDLDGYILPTRDALSDDRVTATADQFRDDKSNNHEYTDMKTVYQTPSAGKDVDLDGYLLP